MLELRSASVGPWPMNAYAFVCPHTRHSVLIDPGAEPETLQRLLDGTIPQAILLTHTHPDHIGALDEMRTVLGVPVLAHAGPHWQGVDIHQDGVLVDGDIVPVGEGRLRVAYTPGHTEDMLCFLDAHGVDAVVGDTLFEGGPGKTWSPEGFRQTLRTLRDVVLTWPDETRCHPGHGASFRLGDIRARIEAFLAREYGDFYGDATWDMGLDA
ncbi:hypothetical protein ARMA_0254 [Ardenticatena maritima]|uniref:Beta-lactamase n=1 Tax=Ardenticatena maritima TaxID=872965 RepID=A0A0M8K6K3_9CHLR|nr:MBL fold metallo-hydrolase [Ardenticatena maritima]KPL87937.1 beta-lactamase [Ardenticatena maritima]GAP61831.1 hypothetical protein ARMA_0254 [Ardenticatena maritima]